MTKTVLLVSTDYPPLAGTNTRRLESFARYLPDYGWKPLVLTLAVEDMALIESSWQGDGAVDTVRIKSPGLQASVRRLRGQRPHRTGSASPGVEGASTADRVAGESIAKRVAGSLWSRLVAAERALYVPDPRRLWSRAASRAAVRLAATQQIDAVVTSSPPFSAHFVGMHMQRRLGTPWIADFRDLWVGRPYRTLPYHWQHRLDRIYEARVIRHLDHLVLASPGWMPLFEQRYGTDLIDKTTVITNGFDADKLDAVQSGSHAAAGRSGSVPITIVYTGALHDGESPWPLIRAIARVAEQMGAQHVSDRLRLRLIGPGASDWEDLRAFMKQRGLAAVVEFLGTLSHAECLAEQQRADVLLILSAPPHEETIRGKSFEYMAAGKPILALLPARSTQAEILTPSRLATIVQHGDVDASAEIIGGYLRHGVTPVEPDWAYIRRFERRELTSELAAVLDRCIGVARQAQTESAQRLHGASSRQTSD